MMQHDQCLAGGCMASFVQNSLGLEPPKFPIGSRVSSLWSDENDNLRCDVGYVVGIFPAPKNWTAGWWYVVRLDQIDGCSWLTLPHDDECHESELQACGQDCG